VGSGFAKALIPIGVIVVVASAGLWLVRGHFSAAPTTTSSQPSTTGTTSTGASDANAPAELRVGAILPDFQLRDVKTGSDLAASSIPAKVKLINFWATWCEACMVEMPSIIKLHQAYKSKGLEVIAVNLDSDPPAVVPKTSAKYGMSFPVYMDVDSRLADFFNIQAIPLTVIIDAHRKILMIENEGVDWNGSEFTQLLDRWLSG
jgi:thiol-disulfide isomerase/thioredoxin